MSEESNKTYSELYPSQGDGLSGLTSSSNQTISINDDRSIIRQYYDISRIESDQMSLIDESNESDSMAIPSRLEMIHQGIKNRNIFFEKEVAPLIDQHNQQHNCIHKTYLNNLRHDIIRISEDGDEEIEFEDFDKIDLRRPILNVLLGYQMICRLLCFYGNLQSPIYQFPSLNVFKNAILLFKEDNRMVNNLNRFQMEKYLRTIQSFVVRNGLISLR
ncbi:UNKNOWN [Stylonychia lemnae]|uniref:Uncharacterized protein n=1 Tax=Stylonychia lemnae TaxID=5949 RepID=A0A077ZX06_STYLE|nr:UNKNOWN [Stylonychia lemnae]|eukprot:CDW74405.1 UNKNOWN [Stylonychia lemnae]